MKNNAEQIADALDTAMKQYGGGKGISQNRLSSLSGVSQATISRTLKAGSIPETGTLLKLVGILGDDPLGRVVSSILPPTQQISPAGIPPSSYSNGNAEKAESSPNVILGPVIRGEVPLISWVQAGEYQSVVDNYAPGCGAELIPTTVPVNRHTYALRVKGDSMTNPNGWPSFPEGMIIIVEPEFEALPSDFVIVKNGAEEATFKQLIKDGPDWYLKPLNPRYPIKPLTSDLRVVGVVRGYGGLLR